MKVSSRSLISGVLFGFVLFILQPTRAGVISGPMDFRGNTPGSAHSYFLLSPSDWNTAEAEAVQLGGHLVTVNDATENLWLMDTFARFGGMERGLWLGLNDVTVEGTFVWSSGEATGFVNWGSSQPANADEKDYVYMLQPGIRSPFVTGEWNATGSIASTTDTPVINGVVELPFRRTGEISVNSTQAGAQGEASVANDAAGNSVVVWNSEGQDGSGWGIYGQRLDSRGVPLGGEFRVNNTTAGNQQFATVAMNAAGDFVVAWETYGQDGSAGAVYARCYSSLGVAKGDEFRVNTTTTNSQSMCRIAMNAEGGFVVVWASYEQDGSEEGIYARRYDAAGIPLGGEFRVNTTTANNQYYPSAAMNASGSFVVAWCGDRQDGSGWGIYAQRYNVAGVPQGGEFRVNTTTDNSQAGVDVGMDLEGNFVVTWESEEQDGSLNGIYAQRYDATGMPRGGEFRVNGTVEGNQTRASVAMAPAGDFLVTWNSDDGSVNGVFARHYNAEGVPQGGEFRVNTTIVNFQGFSWTKPIASDGNGNFTIAWESDLQDGSSHGIYATRLLFSSAVFSPTILTRPASNLRLDRATFNAIAIANGADATVKFEYGLTAEYTNSVAASSSVTEGMIDVPVFAAIDGLQPNTTYHFRAVASNSAGTSFGSDATFTTSVNIPPVVTLSGAEQLIQEVGAAYTDPGATAEDADDGPLTPVLASSSVQPNRPGIYKVTWTVTDRFGATGSATRTVLVRFPSPSSPEFTLVASTGTPAPHAGEEGGPASETLLSSFGSPAIGDLREMAARTTMSIGRKKLSGIYLQGGAAGPHLVAFEGGVAPGVADAVFKSFKDPVLAPNGAVAFSAKLSGKGASAGDEAVFTTAFDGTLQLVLRENFPIPGLPADVLLKSITSISLRDGGLLALVALKGHVTTKTDTALVLIASPTVGTVLLREGEMLIEEGSPSSTVTMILTLSPALGSGGHGRWHADDAVAAKVTLADKRQVFVKVSPDGVVTPILSTKGPVSYLGADISWSKIGLPALGSDGKALAIHGALRTGIGGVTVKNDDVIVCSTDSLSFKEVAREGAAAPGIAGASFASFFDPVVNDTGDIAFLATVAGATVKPKNKTGLWWGAPEAPELVARLGSAAPDASGIPSNDVWSAFVTYALPSGFGAKPLFVAKVNGPSVTSKNILGLWAVDSTGLLRQLLRTGNQVSIGSESKTVANFTLLNAAPGVFGATRSYSFSASVALLATFTDKSQALLRIDLP